MNQLDWLVNEAKEKGEDMPKTITFCNTLTNIAAVANCLIMTLGSAAFQMQDSRMHQHCIAFHSPTLEQNKERVNTSLRGSGIKGIVVANDCTKYGR